LTNTIDAQELRHNLYLGCYRRGL